MLLGARSSLRSRLAVPPLLQYVRGIHAPLRPDDVSSKAMRRKLVAKERARAVVPQQQEPSAAAPYHDSSQGQLPPPTLGSWFAANALAGFSMALAFSLVGLVVRVVFGEEAPTTNAQQPQPQRYLDELAAARGAARRAPPPPAAAPLR
jgi:hypothetical protein